VLSAGKRLAVHYTLTRGQAAFSCASIVGAFLLLAWLAFRIVTRLDLWQWWVPLALGSGLVASDFASGVVHWAADTWGRDDCPLIGHRLLVPFRVHHINPDDFLRRRFLDTNGEVAFIAIPFLFGLLSLPVSTWWGGPLAVSGFGFCAVGSMTNQIHQWAHLPRPPALVRALQTCGVLLGRAEHAAHHARPYDRQYCITTGWCNRPLDTIGFFRHLETAVTALTGVAPRHDDRRYESRYDAPVTATELSRGS